MVKIAGGFWVWNDGIHVLHVLSDNADGDSDGNDCILGDRL